jgi:hypothetical protein
VTIMIVCEGESHRSGPEAVGQGSHILRAAGKLGVSGGRPPEREEARRLVSEPGEKEAARSS